MEADAAAQPTCPLVLQYVATVDPALQQMVRATNEHPGEKIDETLRVDWIDVNDIPFFQVVPGITKQKINVLNRNFHVAPQSRSAARSSVTFCSLSNQYS